MQKIDLAISPCPNDTFIFGHLIRNGFRGFAFDPHFADVEELNRRALFEQRHSITKLSYFALMKAERNYLPLDAGGALGRGCGPLLIGRGEAEIQSYGHIEEKRRIYIPGEYTTAHLLLRLFLSAERIRSHRIEFIPLIYSEIVKRLREEPDSLGLIIHEERFTYRRYGLVPTVDLGAWWESVTGLPIPLGGIAIRRDLEHLKSGMEEAIRHSIDAANADPDRLREFIRSHAQEMDDAVIRSHISLYVNDLSREPGDEGRRAIEELRSRAHSAGLL
jgi:predicted solute-binding protein